MEFSIRTGATSGIANKAPVSYKLNVDMTEPMEHFWGNVTKVWDMALKHAADGAGSVLVSAFGGPEVALQQAKQVALQSAGILVGGTGGAAIIELNDLLRDAHELPKTAWASYRDSLVFRGVPDTGDGYYQMKGKIAITTSRDGMDFTGTTATETIHGTNRDNTINGKGGVGTDHLSGEAGDDTIYTYNHDNAHGDKGDDRFLIRGSYSSIQGDGNEDHFDFRQSTGHNTVHAEATDSSVGFGNVVSFTYEPREDWPGGYDITSITNREHDTLVYDDEADAPLIALSKPTLAYVNDLAESFHFS